jgi:hypothetical protein
MNCSYKTLHFILRPCCASSQPLGQGKGGGGITTGLGTRVVGSALTVGDLANSRGGFQTFGSCAYSGGRGRGKHTVYRRKGLGE